ncbi:Putative lumazine-binding [Jannaschia faecimaris]|uniref:Putative lumazine-binding n=1 Tax=Jannaschia faecimaris TaxID=1244108 RepID=A0A1H3NMS6_9RHOB|nr:nuclear transport factor 2 family protein [Jannaschia faecimaris]SDY90257.1 Putative lumazine-binding [Jannaschia faecimaris]
MTVFAAVTDVLETYFDGLYHADIERLGNAFHPKAIYATADETPLLYRTMDEYLPVVAKRVSPASRGEVRRDVIESIEFAGENTAFARVRCSIGTKDFIDFLTLVRTNGTWKIMTKIFQITERES